MLSKCYDGGTANVKSHARAPLSPCEQAAGMPWAPLGMLAAGGFATSGTHALTVPSKPSPPPSPVRFYPCCSRAGQSRILCPAWHALEGPMVARTIKMAAGRLPNIHPLPAARTLQPKHHEIGVKPTAGLTCAGGHGMYDSKKLVSLILVALQCTAATGRATLSSGTTRCW